MKFVKTVKLVIILSWLAGCTGSQTKPDEGIKDSQGQVAEDKGPKISQKAMKLFEAAAKAYQKQQKSGRYDYNGLLAGFQKALDQDPKLAEAHYNLGSIHEAMRHLNEAESHYRKAIEIRPDLTLAYANLGALLTQKGKKEKALAVYQKALSKDANNSPVLLNLASIYRHQKKYDLAIKNAAKVLVRDPTNIGAYRIMASVYNDQGDLDMAHLICLRGLQVKGDDPRLHNTLGVVLLKLKRVPEALNEFRTALKHAPDMLTTRLNIAKIALDYRDFRVARGEFEKILEYSPKDKKAAVGLAIALRGTGDVDLSKKHFIALAKRYPKDPLPHWWLGIMALKDFGKTKEALKEFSKFKKLSGSELAKNHSVYALLRECKQNIEMEKKMKEMERKMAEEARRQEELAKKLLQQRKTVFAKVWAEAEKNKSILPPKKPDINTVPFVLVPPAVVTEQDTKVKLVGANFANTKSVVIGQYPPKWKKIDNSTLEMVVPKGIPTGPWDLLVTLKDGEEIYYREGLWVGNKSTVGEKKPQDKKKEATPKKKVKKKKRKKNK
jgi:tetratricopeptide (TPR) repeat protein